MMTPERFQLVEEILQQALARAAAERAASLTQACAGDEALQQEVASLLAAHEQAGAFIEAPAVEGAAKALADALTASAVGRQIAHYQVLSLLGAGGMGEVYLAENLRLGRQIRRRVHRHLRRAGYDLRAGGAGARAQTERR
jgi:hypothetical protein